MAVLGVIVLAGGGATRMGGVPKPALLVAGIRLIDRVLGAAAPLGPVVVVAPPDLPLPADVRRTREDPPGAGPVAALAAGLAALTAPTRPEPTAAPAALAGPFRLKPAGGPAALAGSARAEAGAPACFAGPAAPEPAGPEPAGPEPAGLEPAAPEPAGLEPAGLEPAAASVDGSATDCVVLLGGDLPVITTGDLSALVDRLGDHDAAAFVDGDGHAQWMCSVWRCGPLAARLADIAAATERNRGPSIRALTRDLRLALVEVGGEAYDGRRLPPWFDCDTEDDLRRAEEWLCR